ncbi:MAG: luxQ 7 [Gemmataceae bacterium]|nr:luxQ 7 [Gemmataceae bacterium]
MDPHEAPTISPEVLARRFDLLAADATEYALFLTDPSGRVTCWNLGAERLFGYRTAEVVGQHFSRFFSREDHISGQPEHEIEAALTAGRWDGVRWQVRKDGSRFWCKATLTALYDEAKQVHGFARVMHDLTDGQEREAETRRADDLAEANRAKEEFMALLSHELRNPLSPILNALGILRQMRTDDPVIQQAGGIIERQVRQMVRLVDDLLDISRITKGKLRLTKERVELRAAMNRAADSARPLIEARRHEFSLLLSTEPLWVEGDAGRLEQVAVNLLNNAAKYTDAGGLIRMTVAREGDDAVVRVLDNGVGIPPEMLPRIFDLFTQVDGSLSRSHGGLGIGLALVRTLVEMHGGRVTATSGGLGKGSEFAIKLPVLAGGAGHELTTTLEPGERVGQALRVLVVEDNVDAGDSLSMLLRLYGHDVLVARTGPTALEVAAAFHPSLVLLDIGLPGMDGYEVARRLRANPGLTGMTLCALTGYTPSEADQLRPQQSGFDYHFVKPVGLDTLLGLLKGLG